MKLIKCLVLCFCLGLNSLLSPISIKAEEMNWTNTNGVWTLNDDKGNLIKGWYKDANNCWYMLDWSTGEMRKGWVASGSDWYYMNPANGIMQTGWQKINGDWYYMQTSGAKAGAILKGSMLLDGVKQNFDPETGKLLNKGEPMYSGYENVDTYIKKTLSEIIKPGMSEREELKAVHDYVANTLSYGSSGKSYGWDEKDDQKLLGKLKEGLKRVPGSGKSNKSEMMIYRGYEALLSGKGVCGDYTAAFNLLADALGYKTSYMNGQYNKSGHEWSLVWLNGEWLMMDVQIDDSVEGKLLEIGFLKSYEGQKEYKAESNHFSYHNPEDNYAQNTRYWFNDSYLHEDYETVNDAFEYFTQNYLYTGN